MPVETLDALVGLGERAILVRGNADRELVAVAAGGSSAHAGVGVGGSPAAGRTRSTFSPVSRTRSLSIFPGSG